MGVDYGSVRDRVKPPWAVTRGEMARLLGYKCERTVGYLYKRLGIREQDLRLPPRPGKWRSKYPVIHWKDAKRVYQTVKLRQAWNGPKSLSVLGEPPPFPWDRSVAERDPSSSTRATRSRRSSSTPSTKPAK